MVMYRVGEVEAYLAVVVVTSLVVRHRFKSNKYRCVSYTYPYIDPRLSNL